MKKIKFKNLVLGFVAAIALACVAGFGTAHADNIGLTLSPMTRKLVLAPGDSYTGTVSVHNPSSETTIDYEASAKAFFAQMDKENNYSVTIGTENDYTAMKDWITIDETKFSVAPQQSHDVEFTIKVPEDAIAGGQYAAIFVSTKPGEGGEGVAIQDELGMSSTIYASISGSAKYEGKINSNNIPAIIFSGSLETSTTVTNEGNVHGDVTSYIQVFPLFSDEEVYTNEEEPTVSLVLPSTNRVITNTWKGSPALGLFRVRQTVEAFGAKSAEERIVLICPLWFAVIVIVLVAVAIYWLVSRAIRRKK